MAELSMKGVAALVAAGTLSASGAPKETAQAIPDPTPLKSLVMPLKGGSSTTVAQESYQTRTSSTQSVTNGNVFESFTITFDEKLNRMSISTKADVLFEFDKSTLTPDGMKVISDVSKVVGIANDKLGFAPTVSIGGHTDSIGSDQYNNKLSADRATTVMNSLRNQGVNKIEAWAFGESYPVAPNVNPDGTDNPTGRAQNRRVDASLGLTKQQYEAVMQVVHIRMESPKSDKQPDQFLENKRSEPEKSLEKQEGVPKEIGRLDDKRYYKDIEQKTIKKLASSQLTHPDAVTRNIGSDIEIKSGDFTHNFKNGDINLHTITKNGNPVNDTEKNVAIDGLQQTFNKLYKEERIHEETKSVMLEAVDKEARDPKSGLIYRVVSQNGHFVLGTYLDSSDTQGLTFHHFTSNGAPFFKSPEAARARQYENQRVLMEQLGSLDWR